MSYEGKELKVSAKYRELYFDTKGGGRQIVTGEFCEPEAAAEIVKRWNAYERLISINDGNVKNLRWSHDKCWNTDDDTCSCGASQWNKQLDEFWRLINNNQ